MYSYKLLLVSCSTLPLNFAVEGILFVKLIKNLLESMAPYQTMHHTLSLMLYYTWELWCWWGRNYQACQWYNCTWNWQLGFSSAIPDSGIHGRKEQVRFLIHWILLKVTASLAAPYALKPLIFGTVPSFAHHWAVFLFHLPEIPRLVNGKIFTHIFSMQYRSDLSYSIDRAASALEISPRKGSLPVLMRFNKVWE